MGKEPAGSGRRQDADDADPEGRVGHDVRGEGRGEDGSALNPRGLHQAAPPLDQLHDREHGPAAALREAPGVLPPDRLSGLGACVDLHPADHRAADVHLDVRGDGPLQAVCGRDRHHVVRRADPVQHDGDGGTQRGHIQGELECRRLPHGHDGGADRPEPRPVLGHGLGRAHRARRVVLHDPRGGPHPRAVEVDRLRHCATLLVLPQSLYIHDCPHFCPL